MAIDSLNRLLKKIFLPEDPLRPYTSTPLPILPFEIRSVKTNAELIAVAKLRLQTFRANDKVSADPGNAIDAVDYADNSLVIAAFEKRSNKVLGTMRLTFGNRGKTVIEQLTQLPGKWGQEPFGEARMLCVPPGEHSRIVLVLMCKLFYQACRAENLRHMVIGARKAMEPFYRILCFEDLADEPVQFTLPGTTVSHRVMGLDVSELKQTWDSTEGMDMLLRIFFEQTHADLTIPASGPLLNPLASLSPPTIRGTTVDLSEPIYLTR